MAKKKSKFKSAQPARVELKSAPPANAELKSAPPVPLVFKADILALFNEVLERDRKAGLIQDWMIAWYWKELNPQFGDSKGFKGPSELLGWLHGQSRSRRYHNPADLGALNDAALPILATEQRILGSDIFRPWPHIITEIDLKNHAMYSAQDFYFQNIRRSTSSREPYVVLDFGSGCGRMASPWTQDGSACFVSVDGIPPTYCLQHLFYSLLGAPYIDYLIDPSMKLSLDKAGIVHIPSWRLDLLPDRSVDLVSAVQVLGEIRPEMLRYVLDQFSRILRPGGRMYVRDHGIRHNPNAANISELIASLGFNAFFEPNYVDMVDIHGVPKIWIKPS